MNVSNQIHGDPNLETQVLEHDLVLDECTLKGFWKDEIEEDDEKTKEAAPRIPITMDLDPFPTGSLIDTIWFDLRKKV